MSDAGLPITIVIHYHMLGGYRSWTLVNQKTIHVLLNNGDLDIWKRDILGFWHLRF